MLNIPHYSKSENYKTITDCISWALAHGYNPLSSAHPLPSRISKLDSALRFICEDNYEQELLEVVNLAHEFLHSLPNGWLGKTTGDVGALNDFYVKSRAVMRNVVKIEKA